MSNRLPTFEAATLLQKLSAAGWDATVNHAFYSNAPPIGWVATKDDLCVCADLDGAGFYAMTFSTADREPVPLLREGRTLDEMVAALGEGLLSQ